MTAVAIRPESVAGDELATEPMWLLRINPLRRARISDPILRELLRDLVAAEREVAAAAERAADRLYALIGAAGDDERKPLVDARRAIGRDKLPRELPDEPAVAAWAEARQRRLDLRERYAAEFPAGADRERAALARLLGDEDLRRSLALLAPEVYQQAERYRAAVADAAPVPARLRKSERGLIQYVTRAMVRTSPLSRFTAVGIAVPEPAGDSPNDVRFTGAAVFPGLDRVMLGYVLGGLDEPTGAALLDAYAGLSPTSAVNPATRVLYFLRPTPTGLARAAVPVRGPVELLVDATLMGPRPVRSMVREIVGRIGGTDEAALQIVAGGVGNGILCTYPAAEDGGADLDRLLTRPETAAGPALDAVRAGLSRLDRGPAETRGADLEALSQHLATVSRIAGRPAQVTIEEDYILPPRSVDTRSWRPALADLGGAVELLSVFDWLHDIRRLTTAAFVERFGSGADVRLTEHADHLVEEVSRRAVEAGAQAAALDGDDDLPPPGDDPLERLYAVRRRIMRVTRDEIRRAARAGEPEVRWSRSEAYELAAGLPEVFRRDPLSYGVLAQWADGRIVFNDGLPGHGMLYSRFLDTDRRLGGDAIGTLRRRLRARFGWDGSVVAEDLGLHRLNVNAHPRILPDGLSADDWFALRLVHDPETDTLSVRDAEDRRLRILPLGTGHPGLLPAPLSVASSLATGSRLNNYLLDQWYANEPGDPATTRVAPRVAIGDVIIARRRWYGGGELDTALSAAPDEHQRLLAVAQWRDRHGVPDEVVVKTSLEDEAPQSLRPEDAVPQRQNQKPQYVDLNSAMAVRVLPRMLERRAKANTVDYLEEALPGVVDDTHAHEWVVEIGRRPGGLFRYEGGDR